MGEEVVPTDRRGFLEMLDRLDLRTPEMTEPKEELLSEIEDLGKEAKAQMEYADPPQGGGWYGDPDHEVPYQDIIREIRDLLGRVNEIGRAHV